MNTPEPQPDDRPQDMRSRILSAATRLFATRGYDGTSIQAIAEAVGITRPTLVYHFGSKDQLRSEVLEAMLGRWRDELPARLQAATSGSDRFRSAVDALLSFFHADPHRARLLLREILDRPEEMATRFRDQLLPWTMLLTDYIRTGQAEGRIRREVDPEAYVLQFLNAAIGTIATGGVTRAVIAGNPDLERQLAELVRIARRSLFNDRPHPE